MNKYDVVILGNNLNSLICASLLATCNISVGLFSFAAEEGNGITFPLQYSWDASRGAMAYFLETLKMDNSSLVRAEQVVDQLIFRDFQITRPTGWFNYRDLLISLYGEEKENLLFYFDEINSLGEEWIELLKADSIFQVKNIKKTLQYRNMTYNDFVVELFSSSSLKQILLSDLPRDNVSLTVMAGYLSTQVFDYHSLTGGVSRFRQALIEYLNERAADLHLGEFVQKVTQEEEDSYLIHLKSRKIQAANIISTWDEPETFNACSMEYSRIKKALVETGNSSHILSLVMKESYNFTPWGEGFRVRLFDVKNLPLIPSHPIDIYIDREERTLDIYFPDFDRELSAETQVELILAEIDKRYSVLSCIKKRNLIQRDDWALFRGISRERLNQWAFLPDEMKTNPFNQQFEYKNFYTTGRWGGAWFTSAIAATRELLKSLNPRS